MRKYLGVIVFFVLLLALGCAATDNDPFARLGVKIAVVEYIGDSQERADNVLKAEEAIRFFINDAPHPVPLDELNNLLVALVNDSTRLTPAEKVLLGEAVSIAMSDLGRIAPGGVVDEATRERALYYLDAVKQAAELVSPPARRLTA